MGPFRIFFAALLLALATGLTAAAQGSVTTEGTAEIQERGGIEATGEVLFQDILLSPDIELSPTITTVSTGSANLSVLGDASEVSIAVPAAIDLTVAGGGDSLTIMTATDGSQPTIIGLSGVAGPGEILSVDIGGEISVKPDDLAPGEYRGLLVVVAQYN